MVNKRDVEVFIVYLSCHFDVGLFHVIGQEVPDTPKMYLLSLTLLLLFLL
jgi:hypothetical protein